MATELHSLLSESLEQRAELAGRMPDEEMAVELLREFGEPEDVAARYDEPRYLIGPRLYPTLMYVVLIIVIVPAVVAMAGNTIGWGVNGRGWHWDAIAKGIVNTSRELSYAWASQRWYSPRAYDVGRKHGPARAAALAGDRQRRAVLNP